MSHNQTMNPPGRYERDYCKACGQYTERRLMSHIPHLCEDCLGFKQPRTDDRNLQNVTPRRVRDHYSLMLEQLHTAATKGRPPFR